MTPGFQIKSGDRLPVWADTILDRDGNPASIQGQTLQLNLRRMGYATPKITGGAVTNLDDGQPANKGKFSYAWAAGDTDTPGLYLAEIKATSGSGDQRHPTGSFYVLISPAVA